MLNAIVLSGWLSWCPAVPLLGLGPAVVSGAPFQLLLWVLLEEAVVLSPLPFVLTHFQEGSGADKTGDKREQSDREQCYVTLSRGVSRGWGRRAADTHLSPATWETLALTWHHPVDLRKHPPLLPQKLMGR